ncbi:DUF2336 domain-containing protein [Pelagibacterium lentulum]|uniref:DUF2336 domain-containing protein n=1 Tax=Pelagibacterium lentulum TaxID=2029865 RepID=A0A916RI73_9HYPH|nr:DUF2336 domain-containing protein [Pelagibacterium lentulum]GGA54637.1 hypothetical protein GCM10011499_26010 [Pelagibacterium lentulum]
MIGFQPYETFQLLVETGGVERANTLLVAACDAFAKRPRPLRSEIEQFEALAQRLFPNAAPSARSKAALTLATADNLTPELEALVIDHLGTALNDYLIGTKSISEEIVMRLIDKGDKDVLAALAQRPDLTNTTLARLFPINSRKIYRALAANTAIEPKGAYLSALTRSAHMDHEVARLLSERDDFDAALLTPAFFDLPEAGRLKTLRAYAHRRMPQAPMMRTFEHISVATNEFTTALMKLLSDNRRPRITHLLKQVTGLDEIRCGEIAHDTSGAALFVVLRAFGCTSYDGLKVLIHATSHDADRSKTLAEFAQLFEDVHPSAMVYMMSAWRGDVNLFDLVRPEYAPFQPEGRRPAAKSSTPLSGTAGAQAIDKLNGLKTRRAS